ncbi:MAG: mRNA surveillance protein pelota [Candidatus Aenigmarchaeota archaeon]|nr:mRNA surveillance protein pelota [Candidatus Aenigmarchaeota archaeon]PIV68154.1 MAG: mRNA surveillance protein pelota [Candidatus Aenigmarchaeota archaeon CG01_land_8_20_14_3_00_37_9]PIX50281.1 MAG: mRNA surveillance protein pelota [Candidatus Aenigmarchaeota archaeon CG_4_8_14_3_um_filter_37_24]PIY35181.1 MAG: mRNA surveillance protein pelota [Candidatus Aenigmarchaeota archaeon CG_4_10_14_3_um_filter_37_21]PJB74889.1 MAG: mRNA surveillance protein pelota [Candidatus Aenigmarchaeota archae
MKIIKSDLKQGLLTVKVEVEEDLWHLKNIVEIGDKIKSRTMRSLFIERNGQKIKTGKKPMILKLELEKIEFNESLFRLRLMGKILEGPDDVQLGSYHTIEIGVNDILSIIKKTWKKYQLQKIQKSQKKTPKVLLAVVDNNEATFAMMGSSGLKIVSDLRNQYSIQYEEEKTQEFYKAVATEIERLSSQSKKIILAGPGFAKEHVKKIIQKNNPEVDEFIILDSTSSATKSGISELLKRGNLDKVIQENEIAIETKLVEEFFSHLKKDDGLVAYGFDSVKGADDMGAIEIILVSDQKIKDSSVEKLLNSVESKGGKVEVISTAHESGDQFDRMGGLGAILRFKFSY